MLVIVPDPHDKTESRKRLTLASKDALRLPTNAEPLFFTFVQSFHVAPRNEGVPNDFKVYTDGYAYTVSDEESMERELLAWHWHPRSPVKHPHIHIGHKHPDLGGIAGLHIPTGRVAFEEVVRFLARDMQVVPSADDWEEALDECLNLFVKFRSWPNKTFNAPK